MMLSRSIRRCAALATVFALSLQALWPLLAQARPQELSLLAPLCTVDGVTHYLEIKAGRSTPLDERSAQHGEHCKLCVLGTDKAITVPAAVAPQLSREADRPIGSQAERFLPSSPLLSARPRAPPEGS